jgi:hypothetical protein
VTWEGDDYVVREVDVTGSESMRRSNGRKGNPANFGGR